MTTRSAKPFLKWAGGKTQLIKQIEALLPQELVRERFTYIEPFVGSGAMMFWMLNYFPNMERVVINDINADLINTYNIIATQPMPLIEILIELQKEYHGLVENVEQKKEYYYQKRELFNARNTAGEMQAALFIFLNRTCFNGLYRVNKNNQFNVPQGSYKMPTICDAENIMAVSRALERVEILCGDYEKTLQYANESTLFYFDPPYKPLSTTSSFNSYAKDEFDDSQQIRLRNFCNILDQADHKWILSNSDVKEKDENDNFFDDIYADYLITRIQAKRNINANPEKRGNLSELLITNYPYEQALSIA